MARRCIVFALALLASRSLSAQTPAGPEFRVNTFTAEDQTDPAL